MGYLNLSGTEIAKELQGAPHPGHHAVLPGVRAGQAHIGQEVKHGLRGLGPLLPLLLTVSLSVDSSQVSMVSRAGAGLVVSRVTWVVTTGVWCGSSLSLTNQRRVLTALTNQRRVSSLSCLRLRQRNRFFCNSASFPSFSLLPPPPPSLIKTRHA